MFAQSPAALVSVGFDMSLLSCSQDINSDIWLIYIRKILFIGTKHVYHDNILSQELKDIANRHTPFSKTTGNFFVPESSAVNTSGAGK